MLIRWSIRMSRFAWLQWFSLHLWYILTSGDFISTCFGTIPCLQWFSIFIRIFEYLLKGSGICRNSMKLWLISFSLSLGVVFDLEKCELYVLLGALTLALIFILLFKLAVAKIPPVPRFLWILEFPRDTLRRSTFAK